MHRTQDGGMAAASLDALVLALSAGDPARDVGLRLRIGTAERSGPMSRRAAARLAGVPEATLRDTERRMLEIDAAVQVRCGVGVVPVDVRKRLSNLGGGL